MRNQDKYHRAISVLRGTEDIDTMQMWHSVLCVPAFIISGVRLSC